MKYLYCGTSTMALVIGLLTGMSASPVVAVVIPLLFSAVTAGGAVYAFNASEDTAASRKTFLGINAVLFASGFLTGLWLGVAAKVNPGSIWPGIEKPFFVYTEVSPRDATTVIALIEIERRMIEAGTSAAKRKELLAGIVESVDKRRRDDGTLDTDDRRTLEKVALPQTSDPSVPFFPIANNPSTDDSFGWVKG